MQDQRARLRTLLLERHWQKHSTFSREYQKAAGAIDSTLISSCPSRAQLHRWMSGQLKGLPYPDSCRVLEQMFPGWTAKQLMEPCDSEPGSPIFPPTQITRIAESVARGIENPEATRVEWASASTAGRAQVATLPRSLSDQHPDESNDLTRSISKGLLAMAKVRRLSDHETEQLASLAGSVVELDLLVDVDIGDDGWAEVRYRHELFNMSSRPVTRLAREVWFENTDGLLVIEPTSDNDRRVGIQRTHDTAHSAKFSCQISPPIQPGEHATVAYFCKGGQFVGDHYWRQTIARYTRHFTLRLRHRGATALRNCAAMEEHPDGAENSAAEDLIWDTVDGDVSITLTRDFLSPNQAMTLRWEVWR